MFQIKTRMEAVKVGKELYHGSPLQLKQLRPYFSELLGGKRVVFATPFRPIALCFAAGHWTDDDIALGLINGKPYIKELRPDAFRAFRSGGYIYTVPSAGFKTEERLGAFEMYTEKDPIIKDMTYVSNVMDELKKSDISITYA